jgi:hypothetical protein
LRQNPDNVEFLQYILIKSWYDKIKKRLEIIMELFEKSRQFIYRFARPLDLARFRYHFECASREEVLAALSFYQNPDGGFGHALEADAWNPNSSPIQTWCATEILREIGLLDASHPIICGILNYLTSGRDFDGHFWYTSVRSNNDAPHAPWWHTDEDTSFGGDYNPTACLAGFILRYAENGSLLYRLGLRIAGEACDALMANNRENDMHTTLCFIRMCEYLRAAGEQYLPVDTMLDVLRDTVDRIIDKNDDLWDCSYACRPSQFIESPDSLFSEELRELALCECEVIRRSQLEDGSWEIPWGWGSYPEAWPISRLWWKVSGIIAYNRFLKNFG